MIKCQMIKFQYQKIKIKSKIIFVDLVNINKENITLDYCLNQQNFTLSLSSTFISEEMDLISIRNKYKQILKEDDSKKQYQTQGDFINQQNYSSNQQQQSQREWINIINEQKQLKNQKRILSQCTQNNNDAFNRQNMKKSSINDSNNCRNKSLVINKQNLSNHSHKKQTSKKHKRMSSQQQIIELKQKLAQSLLNSTRKDQQIKQFQTLLIKKNQQIKLINKTVHDLGKVISQKDNVIVQQKIKFDAVQKIVKAKQNTIQEGNIENQMLKKHLEYYQREIKELNQKINASQKKYNSIEKELAKNQQLKNKNQKFKDDIKRLQFLLADHDVYAPLLVSLQGKHFLGKPSKQSKQLEYWYPQCLINGIEKFLKRQQIGHGNKTFIESLVKFIYGILQRVEKKCERKCKNKHTSQVKQLQRKKNHILNVFQTDTQCKTPKNHVNSTTNKSSRTNRITGASSLRKTTPLNGNSQIRSRDLSICLQKSLILQRQTLTSAKQKIQNKRSFLIQGLQKSVKLNQNYKQNTILQLVDSFIEGLQKLFELDNRSLIQQKCMQLCQWLKESVEEIYSSFKNKKYEKDVYNETGKWKTMEDF